MSDLIVEFGDIIETPTVFPEELGKLEITVTNQGNENVEGATVELYASTDRILDNQFFPTDTAFNNASENARRRALNTNDDIIEGTDIGALQGIDELLGTIDGINLASGEEQTFTIDFASDEFRTASVVSAGAYNLIAKVDPDNDIAESNEKNNRATQFISSDGTDAVLDWNSAFLNAVQAEGKAELGESLSDESTTATIPGVAPPVMARDGAILHTAIYEAVNALSDNPNGSSLNNLPDLPQGASQEAAAVGAAYTVLSELFVEQKRDSSNNTLSEAFLTQQQDTFNRQRKYSLAQIDGSSQAERTGFDFGVEIAETILQDRSNDGAAFAQVPYEPGNAAGDYREFVEERQNPDNQVTALLPEWGRVIPFAIDSTARFRPEGPPAFSSTNYAEEIEEVRLHGGLEDTDVTTVERTEDETEIALFWSYDRADTFRPPGQWNEIAQEAVLSQEDINSVEDNALLFAQLNIAMADAGIVAWDAKYASEQLRPITAIRNADSDNNPNTQVDPDWEPLLPTPNFPDYISGHSAFGGAAAGVLEDFFGEDMELEISSQELPGVTRTFTGMGDRSSFEQAAIENADSRLYGGVHVDISNGDGVRSGLEVANYILNEGNIFA